MNALKAISRSGWENARHVIEGYFGTFEVRKDSWEEHK